MAKFAILWVAILLAFSVANAEYLKYKDAKQPLGARIKDLMSRMTLQEKIGQMTQIERSVASAEVMAKYFIGNSYLQFFVSYPHSRCQQYDSCWVFLNRSVNCYESEVRMF